MEPTDLEPTEQDADTVRSSPVLGDQRPRYLLHLLLFVLTYVSVSYSCAGFVLTDAEARHLLSMPDVLGQTLQLIWIGFPYATLLMAFLSAHEFGHYFAARAHGVNATLPYYLPMPFLPFGTLGAVIRTRSPIYDRRALFDIGVAGPLAGFVVALAYLVIGMLTLPGIQSLYAIHPTYRDLASIPDIGLHFGGFLLLSGLREILVAAGSFFPPANEIYHYPLLGVGWFAMFVTSLNLLPVGQLDGGHIVYGMFGSRQKRISRWFMRFLIVVGIGWVGLLLLEATRAASPDPVYRFLQSVFGPLMEWVDRNAGWWFKGWPGWLLWYAILRFFIRVDHPPVPDDTPLDRRRMAIGWVALVILVLTFSYTGVYDNGPTDNEQGAAQTKP